MSKVRVIGDVHGKYKEFIEIVKEGNLPVIQLGDFGLNYKILDHFHQDSLRIIFGNHEHHVNRFMYPHFLNSYGEVEFHGIKFYYVGGGYSLNWKTKLTEGWFWREEELRYIELDECIKVYEDLKPDVVMTHDAPREICDKLGSPSFLRTFGLDPETFTTRTSAALQCMFEAHKPKIWFHGHLHRDLFHYVKGTRFISLGELSYVDFDGKDISI